MEKEMEEMDEEEEGEEEKVKQLPGGGGPRGGGWGGGGGGGGGGAGWGSGGGGGSSGGGWSGGGGGGKWTGGGGGGKWTGGGGGGKWTGGGGGGKWTSGGAGGGQWTGEGGGGGKWTGGGGGGKQWSSGGGWKSTASGSEGGASRSSAWGAGGGGRGRGTRGSASGEIEVFQEFEALPLQHGRQLSYLFQKTGRREAIGEVTCFAEAVRVQLLGMQPASWTDPKGYVTRGFHGTDAAGAIGVLREGRVRPSKGWEIVFWRGVQHVRSAADVLDFFLKNLKVIKMQLFFELSTTTQVTLVQGGGHDEEERVAHACGTAKYGVGKSSRYTSHPDAIEVTALWVTKDADVLEDLRGVELFSM
jgi:hypothetical protein